MESASSKVAEAILLGGSLLIFGCGATDDAPPVATDQPRRVAAEAPIQTDRTRYVFENGIFGLETTIVATFRAPADQTLYLVNCNGAVTPGLQRLVENQWVDAWMAPINGCFSPPIEIPPGGTKTEKLVIRPSPVMYPPNRIQLEAGTYRVAWYNVLTSFEANARSGKELPLEQRVSAPFTIDMPALVPRRPPQIASVEPPEGSRVKRDALLRVAFGFSSTGFVAAPDSLRLFVDGVDVTSQSTRAGSDDVPISQLEIAFQPSTRWAPGEHDARVQLNERQGNTLSYQWSFTVALE